MTITTSTVTDQIEGRVESVNERGIRIGDNWHNMSKFHPLELPAQGAFVRVDLDPKGFLKSVQLLDGNARTGSPDRKEIEIRRMAVLKAAATFCGGKALNTEVSSADVLKVAEAFERWVVRGGEATN